MTEDRGQRTEDRGQRTEDRGQRTEDRGQRTEDKFLEMQGGEKYYKGTGLRKMALRNLRSGALSNEHDGICTEA